MRLMTTIALMFICSTVFADADLKSQTEKLAQIIQEKDKENLGPSEISEYEKLWRKKCSQFQAKSCFLFEKSGLNPNGRPDHVLLFRGEAGIYPFPGTSVFLRDIIAEKSMICNGQCGFEYLSQKVNKIVSDLLQNSIDFMTSTQFKYNENADLWFVKPDPRQNGNCNFTERGQFVQANALQQCAPAKDSAGNEYLDSLRRFKPLQFLVNAHTSSSDSVLIANDTNSAKRMDTMVSYTSSPAVANQFAGINGRVIVLSVPLIKIKGRNKGDCDKINLNIDEMIDLKSCQTFGEEDYTNESEYDFLFLSASDYIYQTILKTIK